MTSVPVARPAGSRGRWTSFVAGPARPGQQTRVLHEDGNERHRVRVEHDEHTLLIHLSSEDGNGWTCVAIDRPTRAWSVAQGETQRAATDQAFGGLYP